MKRIALPVVLTLVSLSWVRAAEPHFQPGVLLKAAGQPIAWRVGHLVPCVTDWNADGKKDLIVGRYSGGEVRLYINTGTDAAPILGAPTLMTAGGKPIKLDAG